MKQPRTVLITTTINVPHVLTQWAKGLQSDDWIIVAGDLKSPHEAIHALLAQIEQENEGLRTLYLHPDIQTRWESSDIIGWNSIQRRNIALLEAIALKPKYILTIDDDNAPTSPDQIDHMIAEMSTVTDKRFISTPTGWYNPGRICVTQDGSRVIHRGMPLHRREDGSVPFSAPACHIGVGAMLWSGDPDIDAIDRITANPQVSGVARVKNVLTPRTWAPFNSQSTMYLAELAPLMMVWSGVGRYDDIWGSYVARCVMDHLGYGVYYGHPVVTQDRNEHDLIRDLELEIYGMRHTPAFTDVLRDITFTDALDTVDKCLRHVHNLLISRAPFLNGRTRSTLYAWQVDVETAKNWSVKWDD